MSDGLRKPARNHFEEKSEIVKKFLKIGKQKISVQPQTDFSIKSPYKTQLKLMVDKLEKENSKLKETIRDMEERNSSLEEYRVNTEKQNEDLTRKINLITKENEDLTQRNILETKNNEELEVYRTTKEKEILELDNELNDKQARIDDLEDELNSLKLLYKDLETKYNHLVSEYEKVSSILNSTESRLRDMEKENSDLKNNIPDLTSEYNLVTSKFNALIVYASNIQKQLDTVKIDLKEKEREIYNYRNSEWGKVISLKDKNIDSLNHELIFYKSELQKIKSTIFSSQMNVVNDVSLQINILLDNYLVENKKLKRIIDEYNRKEKECTRKWNAVILENNNLIEECKSLKNQFNSQREYYSQIIDDYDKKTLDCLSKIPEYLENEKSKAADYLVKQVDTLMKERRLNQQEKVKLENKIKDLEKFNQEYKAQLTRIKFEDDQDHQENNTARFNDIKNDKKHLIKKIEEYEDLLTQERATSSPSLIADLKLCIASLNEEKQDKIKEIKHLKGILHDYKNSNQYIFDENEIVSSIKDALRVKDIEILNLRQEISQLKSIVNTNTQFASVLDYNHSGNMRNQPYSEHPSGFISYRDNEMYSFNNQGQHENKDFVGTNETYNNSTHKTFNSHNPYSSKTRIESPVDQQNPNDHFFIDTLQNKSQFINRVQNINS